MLHSIWTAAQVGLFGRLRRWLSSCSAFRSRALLFGRAIERRSPPERAGGKWPKRRWLSLGLGRLVRGPAGSPKWKERALGGGGRPPAAPQVACPTTGSAAVEVGGESRLKGPPLRCWGWGGTVGRAKAPLQPLLPRSAVAAAPRSSAAAAGTHRGERRVAGAAQSRAEQRGPQAGTAPPLPAPGLELLPTFARGECYSPIVPGRRRRSLEGAFGRGVRAGTGRSGRGAGGRVSLSVLHLQPEKDSWPWASLRAKQALSAACSVA